MRVTQNMMINNAIRWTSEQMEKLNDAEEVVSAGKQINKSSDDPNATAQILADRTTLSKYAQYISNISEANTWVEADNSTLDAVDTLLSNAKNIILSSEALDSDNADSYAEQLQSIYDQVVDLANTKLSSNYLYSGNNANTAPFANEVAISSGTPSDIVFALAGDASTVTIDITDSSGEVVRTMTVSKGGTTGTNTITWDGLDDNGDLLPDGSYDFTVSASDSSGNAVASYEAYRGNTGKKEVIIGENDSTCTVNNDGGAIFSDALSSLSQAITALKDSSYDDTVATNVGNLIKNAIKQITTEQVSLANVTSQMTTADTRLDTLTTTVDGELSTIETGSTEEAGIKLTAQQTAYETTAAAISSVLKMSKLTDFLS